MRINFLDTNARVEVISGMMTATFGRGTAEVIFGTKGWRGRGAIIQMAAGDLKIGLPPNLSADIDALVLQSGSIENTFPDLKPRDRKVAFTERAVIAKAGVGGPQLKFTVGEGSLRLENLKLRR